MTREPDESQHPYRESAPRTPEPGVVAVWTAGTCTSLAFRIPDGGLVLGRDLLATTSDDRISRQHARMEIRDRLLIVTDLGSRNGTIVGGELLGDRSAGTVP